MDLDAIMAAFGEEFHVEGISPGKDGSYCLMIDGAMVSFAPGKEGTRLITSGDVGRLTGKGDERLLRKMMEAMFGGRATGGAMFALDAETDEVSLRRCDELSEMDLAAFKAMLERFANVLHGWRRILADYSAAGIAERSVEELEVVPTPRELSSLFMHV